MKSGIRISTRYLVKNRMFVSIALLNLTIGISACLLLLKYIRYELSFDKFYPEAEHVYRIAYERIQNGNLDFYSAKTMSALAPSLERDFPEIQRAIRGVYEECLIYRKEEQKYLNKQKVLWADEGFLDIFRIKLIQGDRETALREPYTAIISETQARKLFGDENPMGKSFTHNEGLVFRVTGIFEQIPQNTHLQLEFIYSYSTFQDWPFGTPEGNWRGNWLYTYIRTKEGFDPVKFEALLNSRVHTYMPDLESSGTEVKFHLQPLRDIHLDSNLDHEVRTNGDRKTMQILLLVAMVIILIAWINYLNLLVAQNQERMHEFGIRKVLGESRKNLFLQSILLVLLFNLLALGFSALLVKLTDPMFQQLFDLSSSAIRYHELVFWPISIGLIVFGALLMGIYPSLVGTKVETAHSTSRDSFGRSKGPEFRKVLVVLQFALSAILIFNALALSRQVNFMLSRELGFSSDQVLLLHAPETWCQTPDSVKSGYVDRLRSILIQYPEIEEISAANTTPGSESQRHLDHLQLLNAEDQQDRLSMRLHFIDRAYFQVLGIKLLAGRDFLPENSLDRDCLILNEAAIRALGIQDPQMAINLTLSNGSREFRIVGVVQDHHHQGLKHAIKPMVYLHRYAYDFGFLLLKTTGNPQKAVQLVQQHWEEEFPVAIFDYAYLEDYYNEQYKPEFRLKRIIGLFSLIAMVLACVGLFGLLKYSLHKRIREISVKRVLGAGIQHLMFRLSMEYLYLVLIAMTIAFVLSWWMAKQWLLNFNYRTPVHLWVYLISALIILGASTLILIWHVYKSANRNPVEGLRDD